MTEGELRDEQAELLRQIQARYTTFARRTERILTAVFVLLLLLGTVTTILWFQNGSRVDDIQESRAESIRIACREQNSRHDDTIKTLDVVIEQSSKTASPEERAQAKSSRAYTILLLNAIVPKRDCEQRVRLLLNPPPAS